MPEIIDNTTGVANAGTAAAIAGGENLNKTTTTPTTTPSTTQTATTPTTPTVKTTGADKYKDLGAQALKGGLTQDQLDEGLASYSKGYMDDADMTKWLNKFITAETDKTTTVINDTLNKDGSVAPPVEAGAKTLTDAEAAKTKTLEDQKKVEAETLEMRKANEEEYYQTQKQILADTLAMQKELAAQQQALIASSSAIQKQEAQNAYEANQAAIELQQKKVAEAYQQMQDTQALLNTQRKIREETALGLIYGGFGSVAANKNIEETIIAGEKELMSLKKEATNKDTEFQNQVVELNKTYELDLRKIEQWKVEQNQEVYSELTRYTQEIMNDELLAAADKKMKIDEAIISYNEKVAAINTAIADSKYSLALELTNRADMIKQQDFTNSLAKAQEERAVSEFNYTQARTKINDSRADLDTILSTYATKDYDTLPPDVQAQLTKLETDAGLPSGSAREVLKAIQDQAAAGEWVEKEFTDSMGNVTAVRYNFATKQVETMSLGDVDQNQGTWRMEKDSVTGKDVYFNDKTGEKLSDTSFTGNLPPEFGVNQTGGWCGVYASKISTAGKVGDTQTSKANSIEFRDAPSVGDKVVLPYKGDLGHVMVVTGYDPASQTITYVNSNEDGRQKSNDGVQGIVSTGSISLSEVVDKGGGFKNGELREPYKSALLKAQGVDENSQVAYYVDVAKRISVDEARTQLKNSGASDALMSAFDRAISAQGEVKPVVSPAFTTPIGGAPTSGTTLSILEQEAAAKDGGTSGNRASF